MEGLRYEPRWRVLLCLGESTRSTDRPGPPADRPRRPEHAVALNPSALRRHFYELHGLRDPSRARLLQQIHERYDLAPPLEVPSPAPSTPAITGLRLHTGYACDLDACDGSSDRLSRSLKTLQRHRGRVHRVHHEGAERGIRRVHLQTFFGEKRLQRLFVVEAGSTAADAPALASIACTPIEEPAQEGVLSVSAGELRRSFAEVQATWRDDSFGRIPSVSHQSEETPWLRRTGFRTHLEGLDKRAVQEATAAPGRPRQNPSADSGTDCEEDSETGRDQEPGLHRVADACRGLLEKAHEAISRSGPRSRLSTRHALILASLEHGRQSARPFRPLQNRRSLKRYIDGWLRFLCYLLRLTDPEQASPLAHLLRLPPDQQQAVRALRSLGSRDDESDVPVATTATEAWLTVEERIVMEASRTFVAQSLPENPFHSALLSYVAARGLKADGSWRTPPYMTSFLATLTYDIQLILFSDARSEADQLPHSQAAAFERLLRRNCRRWLVSTKDTPSAEILSWRLYAQRVSTNTLPTAYTSWSPDGETVTYREAILTMTDWRGLIREQLRRATEILHRDLLFAQEDRPRPRAQQLLDIETETRPGYSFVDDARNGLGSQGRWLLERLAVRPELPQNLCRIEGGELRYRSPLVHRYLGRVEGFLEHLLVLVHLTGGLPARAPELISLRHCNDEEPRNVMVHDGQVMLLTGYHKMQYASGSRLVCRFLPAAVGDLLVTYLAAVLPTARFLQIQHGRQVGRSHLFCEGSAPWKEDRLSRVLRRESASVLGQEILPSSYRHLAIAIDRRHLRRMGAQALRLTEEGETPSELAEAGGDLINDLQASHSSRTGDMSYSNSVRTGRIFNDPQLNQFRQVSRAWHELAHLTEAVGSKRPRPGSLQAEPPRSLPTRGLERRRWTQAELRTALVRIHGPEATARSEGQWEALSRMIEGHAQLVVVLPTGGGKSLLFQLTSLLPAAGVTVAILPLVVLKQDLIGKCEALAIPHTVWDSSHDVDSGCAPLLLVSVEEACSKPFIGLLRRLQMSSQLDRICLDEAHMVLTERGYRESLREVRQIRRVTVPFVALTATLPPARERELAEMLFLDQPLVIRRSTNRANLRYEVLAVTEQDPTLRCLSLLEAAAWLVRTRCLPSLDEAGRVICFVPYRSEAEALAEQLGCGAYHAGIEDRARVYEDWLQGRQQVIVGTNALGAGVDYLAVRHAVHVGSPRGAMAFSQESGRAGRDGEPATSTVLLRMRPSGTEGGQAMEPDRRAMQDFLGAASCRRQILTLFLDGPPGVCCADQASAAACDVCTVKTEPAITPVVTDLGAGERLARRAQSLQEQSRSQYLQGLERWMERCVACFVTESDGGWRHPPCALKSGVRGHFQSLRRTLRLPAKVGCFRCANPEWACDRAGAEGVCRWGDEVLLLCHVVLQELHRSAWATEVWQTYRPAGAARWKRQQCWESLAGVGELHGAPAFHANMLAQTILTALPA